MKIFISSTAYDLLDFRAMIVDRLKKRGHEVLHHEIPTFPAQLGMHSHDQCVTAVKHCDLVICIIDKRYGGEFIGRSREYPDQTINLKLSKTEELVVKVPTKELSVTWCELIEAYENGKNVITFARQRTLDEKHTRRKNQKVQGFSPAYVDKNEVFDLLDWITKKEKNNWIVPFDNIVDFEHKLDIFMSEIEKSVVVPEITDYNPNKIGLIVEGDMDRILMRKVFDELGINAEISIIPMYRSYRGLRKFYNDIGSELFKDYDAVLGLFDSDTIVDQQIKSVENHLREFAESVEEQKIYTILAIPGIESWILSGIKGHSYEEQGDIKELRKELRKMMNKYNKPQKVIDDQFDIELAEKNSKSFSDFIVIIKKMMEEIND